MENDYVCAGEFITSYLDSRAEEKGISLEEWEKDQVICTYCEDQAGEPMCPGSIWRAIRK